MQILQLADAACLVHSKSLHVGLSLKDDGNALT